ncbi:hypothetical protein [Nocardia sp. NPDC050710]|uniref:hypothetical protein n=1 Tax=Nocardia sp. NPDC050710 TaxID=3157220 RepID=UPI00340733F6
MTDHNQPYGGSEPQDKDTPLAEQGQAGPTVRWWEQPGAEADPSRNDPTMIGTPAQFGGFQDAYTPPPQPFAAPPTQQQPFAAAPQPPQPPTYGPQAGYPPYGQFPPPTRSRSKAPWIIAGAVVLVIIVAVVVGIVAIVNTVGGGDNKAKGDYSMDNVTNACSLVDITILNRWAPTPDSSEHTENRPSSNIGGGSLNCRAKNKGTGSNDATLTMDADFAYKYSGNSSYQIWKDIDTGTTGTGRTSGPISGLGEEAYFAAREDSSTSFHSLDYTISVKDSNVSVQIEIQIYSKTAIDKSAVAAACEAQARKVLSGLRK